MDDNSVFDDIMQGLKEVEEYQKGNLKLRSDVLYAPTDDISVKYNQLQEDDKRIVSIMIDRLLISNRQAINH